MCGGRVSRAVCSTRETASPSATPCRRLNDNVTDGSCPVWLTDCGPAVWRVVTTAESGTSRPPGACTFNIDNAAGSCWYCGETCMMTWYSSFGAKICEICRDPYADVSADST